MAVDRGGRTRRMLALGEPAAGGRGEGLALSEPAKGRRVEVGREGFEPPKSEDNRFTVCPLWPLGYLPVEDGFNRKSRAREAAGE